MITKKTVVVVGAGASVDLGLPLGGQLKEDVANYLTPDPYRDHGNFVPALRALFNQDQNRIENALNYAHKFEHAMRSAHSIDNFLDQHQKNGDFVLAAKLAIVFCIAEAEKKSKINSGAVEGDFLSGTREYFLQQLLLIAVRGHKDKDLSKSFKNLAFVTFNYDRCIERYVKIWMEKYLGVRAFQPPEVIHIYGSLGELSDLSPFDEQSERTPVQNPQLTLPPLVPGVRIFTEQEDSEIAGAVQERVSAAEAILFLGFGFEEQNMRFFSGGRAKIFASMKSISPSNQEFLKHRIRSLLGTPNGLLATTDGTCCEMLSEHYQSIAAAVGSLPN